MVWLVLIEVIVDNQCYQDATKAGEDDDDLDVTLLSSCYSFRRYPWSTITEIYTPLFSQDEDAEDEDKDDKAGSDVEDHSDDEKHVCCSFHAFLCSDQALFICFLTACLFHFQDEL